LVLVDERAFREAAKSHALKNRGAATAQARRIPRPPLCCFWVQTLEGTAGLAPRARPTRLYQRANDMIAAAELCDIRADLGDDTGDLMAKYRGERSDIVRRKQKIGVTQPGCLHIDENFTPNGRSHINVLKVETTTRRVHY
jgi:hypothetical protein